MKRDVNDDLFSKIIRFGHERCWRCHKHSLLHSAHIISRSFYSTRFTFSPNPNAVPLCFACHTWFDTHKIKALIFEEGKRIFNHKDESYTWLVQRAGYTWDDLKLLYAKSQIPFKGYKWKKKQITKNLRAWLAELKEKGKPWMEKPEIRF